MYTFIHNYLRERIVQCCLLKVNWTKLASMLKKKKKKESGNAFGDLICCKNAPFFKKNKCDFSVLKGH